MDNENKKKDAICAIVQRLNNVGFDNVKRNYELNKVIIDIMIPLPFNNGIAGFVLIDIDNKNISDALKKIDIGIPIYVVNAHKTPYTVQYLINLPNDWSSSELINECVFERISIYASTRIMYGLLYEICNEHIAFKKKAFRLGLFVLFTAVANIVVPIIFPAVFMMRDLFSVMSAMIFAGSICVFLLPHISRLRFFAIEIEMIRKQYEAKKI